MAREGARWINDRPTGEEFGEWFKENVKVAEGLDAADYVGGIVLIPAEEKVKRAVVNEHNGNVVISQVEQLVHIPYAKVETRVAYFWDLMELRKDDLIGVIRPLSTRQDRPSVDPIETHEEILSGDAMTQRDTSRIPAAAQIVEQLPEGFYSLPIPIGTAWVHYLCCGYEAAVYERATALDENGKIKDGAQPIRYGRGTKMVALTKSTRDGQRSWADEHSMMKAETGAIGRALGLAGILVIPGSGVATAEDMMETAAGADSNAAATPADTGPAAPVAEPAPVRTSTEQAEDEDTRLHREANELAQKLRADYPEQFEQFGRWAHERKPPITRLSEARGPALRGVVRRLEKFIQEGEEAARVAAEGEGTPPPAPEPAPAEIPAGPEEIVREITDEEREAIEAARAQEASEPAAGSEPTPVPPTPAAES